MATIMKMTVLSAVTWCSKMDPYGRFGRSRCCHPHCRRTELVVVYSHKEDRKGQGPWLISNLMHKILIYLYKIHLLKSSTCFEHYPAHLQEVDVVIVYMQPLVSSLSAGDCPVHRLRKRMLFLNWCTGQSPAEIDNTRVYSYDVDLLKMSRVMLETCRWF
jgi:hypothetical protein